MMNSPKIVISATNTPQSEFDNQFNDEEKLVIGKEDKSISLISNTENIPLTAMPLLNLISASFGYIEIPTTTHTFIVQWGTRSINADSVSTYSFPKAFPNQCIKILSSQSEGDFFSGIKVRAVDESTHEIAVQGGTTSGIVNWVAIGY